VLCSIRFPNDDVSYYDLTRYYVEQSKENTTGNIENLLHQSRKDGVSDVDGEGCKEKTLTCEDDVSYVGNVSFSKGTQNHKQIIAKKSAKQLQVASS